ncbi:Methionine import ATP-binding protein MetN 2 [Friedmanniomyces endolithicus]|nr:Methionine import ATP-binding protein MetN 2 [Friedmanniomyces endolithicus]
MNTAVANNEVDVNAFQSYAYLVAYNEANTAKIAPLSTTYLEPMGIYSSKVKTLAEFKNGATIAIPNDGANESRALLLLQSAGLVKLKNDFDFVKGTSKDIVENNKALVIKPIQMATAVRVKDEVDAIVLGNTLAMEGGLNVLKDAIYYEPIDQTTKMNVNVLAVAEARQNDPVLKKVGELYHVAAVGKYVQEHFGGTKIDVNKPHYQLKGQTIPALDQINLDIPEGSIFGVIGYSGAGKSTLIRLINLLERPTEGQVIINQKDFTALDAKALRQERANIGMIFQHFNLLQTKTVAANIEMPMKLLGYSKAEREKRLNELLEFIDLKHKKEAYPDELSGGQKQRVGIARALANHPKILLCDEATSALDPQTTKSVLDLLKKINQEQGITIVMVTHEMDVIQSICSHVAVMELGKVVETGKTVDLFSRPQHATTQNFIQTILHQQLPIKLLNNLEHKHHHSIYRLQFLGNSAHETVIQNLIKQFDISLNILFANMIEIDGNVIGQMFVQLLGDESLIAEAVEFLKQHGVAVEQSGELA